MGQPSDKITGATLVGATSCVQPFRVTPLLVTKSLISAFLENVCRLLAMLCLLLVVVQRSHAAC